MGGGSKKQTVGYKYYLGQHLLMTTNKIAILEMKWQEKTAWEGRVNGGQQIIINKPELFGGKKREGGVSGRIDFLDGNPSQGANDYLTGKINPLPAFRYMTSLVFRQFYIGNNYYVKPPVIKATDTQICEAWEAGIGKIGSDLKLADANISIVIDDSTSMNDNSVTRISRDAAANFLRKLIDQNNVQVHVVQSDTELINQRFQCDASDYEALAQWCEALPSTAAGPAFEVGMMAQGILDFNGYVKQELNPFQLWVENKSLFPSFEETTIDKRNVVLVLSDGGITDSVSSALAELSPVQNLEIYCFQFTDGSQSASMLELSTDNNVYMIPSDVSASYAGSILAAPFYSWVDINPVHIIYDVLTGTITRTNENTDRIGNSFMWAAQRLFEDNFGMSIYWRSRRELSQLRDIVQKHIDGKIYFSRDTGKWEISLIRDNMGFFSPQTIVIAIDKSGSMNAQRMSSATQAISRFLDHIRGTPHSVRISFFGETEHSYIERQDCSDLEYDELKAFVESPPAVSGGARFDVASEPASDFFALDNKTYKKFIMITDGAPDPTSSADTARNDLRYVYNLVSYVIQIGETDTQYSSLISNFNNGVVPVVDDSDEEGIFEYLKMVTTGAVFTDKEVLEWKDTAMETPTNLVNQLTMTYRRRDNGEERAITVEDNASIALYGVVNQDEVDYQGIYNDITANQIAQRDLRARSSPKLSGSITLSSAPPGFGPGSPFIAHCPRLGINNRVCRVTERTRRSMTSRNITLKYIEDTFSLDHVPDFEVDASDTVQSGPVNPEAFYIAEKPFYAMVLEENQTTVNDTLEADNDIGQIMVVAAPANGNQTGYELATYQVSAWTNDGLSTYVPAVLVLNALTADPTDNVLSLASSDGLQDVQVDDLVILNGEFLRVDSFDPNTLELTVGRGCLDTIPKNHPANSFLIVEIDQFRDDGRYYYSGEELPIRLLSVSEIGRQPFSSADETVVEFQSRAFRPYPPGNLQVDGEYPLEILPGWTAATTLTWRYRDRQFQTTPTPEDYTAGDIGPETGTTYRIDVYFLDSNEEVISLAQSYTPGQVNTFSFSPLDFQDSAPVNTEYCEVRVFAVRDGFDSLEYVPIRFVFVVSVGDFVFEDNTYVAPTGDVDFLFGE